MREAAPDSELGQRRREQVARNQAALDAILAGGAEQTDDGAPPAKAAQPELGQTPDFDTVAEEAVAPVAAPATPSPAKGKSTGPKASTGRSAPEQGRVRASKAPGRTQGEWEVDWAATDTVEALQGGGKRQRTRK
jgi:hypothetical protein